MTTAQLHFAPLGPGRFGREVELAVSGVLGAELAAQLVTALYASDGLLLLRGLTGFAHEPQALVELSRHFGCRVEDYRETLIDPNMVHPDVPEILVVSNAAPVGRPPPSRPQPAVDALGRLPTQFPHRRGWHSDQSYRRPPPDISLFYAVQPAPPGQGQTLYANGVAAYSALPERTKARIEDLEGIHCRSSFGRNERAVRAGEAPLPLEPHQRPQRQPLVRRHPVTGTPALYLCEAGQMDWVDGPIVGLEPGVDGEGAELVYELMTHYTSDAFVYAHEWCTGDLIIYDNRCTVHSATWFDADRAERVMWRTTVWGNPGPEYANEPMSWRAT